MSVNGEGDKIEWLCKWNICDQQEKGHIRKDQELLIGKVLNIQASIGRRDRDKEGKYQVGTIWEGICLAKHIDRQGLTLSLQAKEDMDKVKARAFTETAAIKSKLQYKIDLVKKIDQGQRWPIESLKR